MREYEAALNTHSWEKIAPCISEDVCFMFSDGTYFGIAEIERAIRKTFALIQDETYEISDVHWSYLHDDAALCFYAFSWTGHIDEKSCAGSGRGTSLLVRQTGMWKIKHEHLGPAAT